MITRSKQKTLINRQIQENNSTRENSNRPVTVVENSTAITVNMGTENKAGQLRYFSGKSSENAGMWFRQYNKHSKNMKWDDSQKLEQFEMYLDGEALNWYGDLPETERETFAKLAQTFESRFDPKTHTRFMYVPEFNSRKLKPGETVDQYIDKMCQLGAKLSKSELDIIDAVTMGLTPQMREHIVFKSPQSLSELRDIARVSNSLAQERESHTVHFASLAVQTENQLVACMEKLTTVLAEQQVNFMKTVEDKLDRHSRQDTPRHRDSSRGRSRDYRDNSQDRYNNRSNSRNRNNHRSQNQSRRYGANNNKVLCHRCKKGTHNPERCYYRTAVCHFCGNIGHIVSGCKTRMARETSNSQ